MAINYALCKFTWKFLPNYVPNLPTFIQIEVTNRCNLNCIMCCHSHDTVRPFLNSKDLTLGEFRKIIQHLPNIPMQLNLQGIGEPLLNPELFEMIKHAKEFKKWVTLTTNGTLLSEENSKKILESGLDRLYISIDAANKNTFGIIRPGVDFDQVLKNIKNLVELTKQKPCSLEIFSETTITKYNLPELAEIVELIKALGLKNIFLSEISVIPGDPKKIKPPHRETRLRLENIKKMPNGSGLNIRTYIDEAPKKTNTPCFWPWSSSYITVEGYVTTCCYMLNPHILCMGNIFKESFRRIWNNRWYRHFRALMKSNLPKFCSSIECPYFLLWQERQNNRSC